jgi:ribonuclease HII
MALPAVPKQRKRRSDAKPLDKKIVERPQTEFVWDAAGLIAGVDVILDDQNPIAGLNDSKKLTASRREKLFVEIQAKALCVSIGQASVEEIDGLNILQATMLAMQRAVNSLRLKPAKVLVDGNRIPKLDVLAEAIVGGDGLVKAISAASIIAKVTRDRQCEELHLKYPEYGFAAHKGYGTAEHLAALKKHGATPAHRQSYAPVRDAMLVKPT